MSTSMNFRHIWPSVWRSAGLKPALCVGIMAIFFYAWCHPAQAADWSIESFRSDISIHTDASITVTERIQANFTVEKHGIFRNIPFQYQTDHGDTVRVPITVEKVTRNGNTENYATSRNGNELEIKIGDADVTVTGSQQYEITYTAQAAVNFFDDHDELYWNVTGDHWDVLLGQVTATARLDTQVPKDQLQVKCFTGPRGSTSQNCTAGPDDSAGVFAAQNEFLTIVFGWPKGIVTKPDNYDQLRAAGTVSSGLERVTQNPIMVWLFNGLLPLGVIGWLIRRWMTHGRDPKGKGTVVAQYEPPDGLTPGEMGTLIDEHANHRDVVATIVDLAVRGFLTITEIEQKKLLGKSKDYRLDRKSGGKQTELKPHEKDLRDSLFGSGDSVTLSSLKGSFSDDVKKIQTDLYTQVRDQGYFSANPSSVRIGYVVVGAIIAFFGFFAFGAGIFGICIAGVAIAIAGPFMPQRTTKGADALWHAKGFKLFLEKAEKYRLQWQEKQHIFEQYLPYAMAFGVAQQWSQTFEGIEQAPPSWYAGAPGSQFNSLLLWSSLNNFSTATVRSFAPPAASGSSGFGGGGFSGGGFGGGGGGSW